jgi:hypothetical protein
MNGYDPLFTLAAARNNFYGSGWWKGTMFVPYNDLLEAAYEVQYPGVDIETEWVWQNRGAIPDEQLQYMLDFWGTHVISTVADLPLANGPYTSIGGTNLVKVGNQIINADKNITATIVESMRWFDGAADQYKVIYVIDKVLY